MWKRTGYAREPSAFAHADLVVEPVDFTIAWTNFARSQRLNRLRRALLKNAIFERSHVRRDKFFARQDKSPVAGQLKRRRAAVRLEIGHPHRYRKNLVVAARIAIRTLTHPSVL